MDSIVRKGDRVRIVRIVASDDVVAEYTRCFLGWVGVVPDDPVYLPYEPEEGSFGEVTAEGEVQVQFEHLCPEHGHDFGIFTIGELSKDISCSELPEEVQHLDIEMLELIQKHGVPKLGRWVYCKYCKLNVLPRLTIVEGLIQCTRCEAGLAPIRDVITAGSYKRWEADLGTAWRLLR